MRCTECKREIADGTPACPACGAPVIAQPWVTNAQPWVTGGPPTADDAIKWGSSSSMVSAQAPSGVPAWEGLAAKSRRRRGPVILAIVACVALAATVAGVQLAYSASQHRAWTRQLTVDQLRPGDCLTGSNLGLGTGSAWPYTVTAVPCTQSHLAEITFVGNLWPASLAKVPGENALTDTVDNRCQSALFTYAGTSQPALLYDSIAPGGGSDWASGDRLVVCMAYEQGVSLRHSIKASHQ